MLNKEYIIEQIRENRTRIEEKGIESIALFGSFSTGDFSDNSDIDLFVRFKENQKNFDNFMDIAFLLEDMFQRKVELITPESISGRFLDLIKKDFVYAY